MRRRNIVGGLGALLGGVAKAESVMWLSPDLPDATRAEAHMVQVPEKKPMIQLSAQPVALETPIQALRTAVTPNDQFFVHYHASGAPELKLFDRWALEVGGDAAEKPVRLTEYDLNDLPQTEVIAVCESAGDRRGLVQPHVEGVQWGYGAVGCATWHGPRLRDVLERAGVRPDAVEVWCEGAGQVSRADGPGFRKSLPVEKALAQDTIVATTMNGGLLPFWNGFPARLVVPGWVGAYWVKHLMRLAVSSKPLRDVSMKTDLRVPAGLYPGDPGFPTQKDSGTWPVTELGVGSVIATPVHGEEVERSGFTVRGVAWDKGYGILRVDVSVDGGKSWLSAFLDRELSSYAFRTFRLETGPLPRGVAELRVRAVSNIREAQPGVWPANAGGYRNNVPQRLTVAVV